MLLRALMFLIGVFGLYRLPELPALWPCLLVLILLLPALLYIKTPWQLPLWAILGFCWAVLQSAALLDARWPVDDSGKEVVATIEVVGIPKVAPRRSKFEARVLALHNDTHPLKGARIRLSWYRDAPALEPGQIWRLRLRLKAPRGFSNPGNFDYEQWLFRHNIAATGYVRKDPQNQLVGESRWSLDRWRARFAKQLIDAESLQQPGILKALLIGDRNDVSPAQWDMLTRTGTNHLLAISGLHIGLAASLGYLLAQGLWRLWPMLCLWYPRQRAAALFSLPPAVIYAALAGFSIPTQRALLMLSLFCLNILAGRRQHPLNVLGWGLLGVLVWDTKAVLDPGFWLSFTAVTVIFLLSTFHPAKNRWHAAWRVQLALSLLLAPLTLIFFSQASVVSPLSNLLAVPYVSIGVVPVLLIGAITSFVYTPLANALLQLADSMLAVFFRVLAWAAELDGAAWHQALGAQAWLAGAVLFWLLLWLLPRGLPGRLLPLVLLIPFAWGQPRFAAGRFDIIALDVGQGLSVVVETAQHTLVYDTGPSLGQHTAAELVLIPFLQFEQRAQIDALVVSHSDDDHAGGVADLLRAEITHTVYSSVDHLPHSRRTPQPCVAGQHWSWDGVNFEFLHPDSAWRGKDNNRSCVLRISNAAGSVLLAGDIERSAEAHLRQTQREKLRSDVLFMPHHGSLTSSTSAFIDAVAPHYAIASVGFRNRFGFPKPEVLQRYTARGIEVLRTDCGGAVRMRFDRPAESPSIFAYRPAHCRVWSGTDCLGSCSSLQAQAKGR